MVATLRRELRDLDAAEDVAQDAFAEALQSWGKNGVPDRPGAWLTTAARRRAYDRRRRDRRYADRIPLLARSEIADDPDATQLIDDQLALVFGCCHRSLDADAQIALTLRAVAGLSTAQIARAFLVPTATMAARLTRAKRKIVAAGVPFVVPSRDRLGERLGTVLSVVYLIYTEGHASGHGESLVRGELCDEALWLADTVVRLVPDEPQALALAALLHLTDVRRPARLDEQKLPVLIQDQDRARWDRTQLERGRELLQRARVGGPSAYLLQAEIAALHGQAAAWSDTDWPGIVRCYDALLLIAPTPVIALNRAAAVAMRDGP